MQPEIEQRELELPDRLHAGLERARCLQLAQCLERQRCAGLDVARDQRQHFLAPGEVLHELARQLDGIPRHAVDAGHAREIHARQHVVQAVAEFVEHRQHFVMRQQRRPVRTWRGEVADEVSDRQRLRTGQVDPPQAFVHPGAAALLWSRVQVEEEAAARLAVVADDVVEVDVGLIHLDALALRYAHAIETLRHREQALQHARQREVRTQLLFRDGQALALEALRVERHVPGFEPACPRTLPVRRTHAARPAGTGAPADAGTPAPRRDRAPSWWPASTRRSWRSRPAARPRAAARGFPRSAPCCPTAPDPARTRA